METLLNYFIPYYRGRVQYYYNYFYLNFFCIEFCIVSMALYVLYYRLSKIQLSNKHANYSIQTIKLQKQFPRVHYTSVYSIVMTENFTAFTHRATSREQLESYSRLDTDHVRLCGLISIARNYVIETSYRGFTIPQPRGQNSYTRVSCNLFLECRIILYRTQ